MAATPTTRVAKTPALAVQTEAPAMRIFDLTYELPSPALDNHLSFRLILKNKTLLRSKPDSEHTIRA
jgi:hypothetical protein